MKYWPANDDDDDDDDDDDEGGHAADDAPEGGRTQAAWSCSLLVNCWATSIRFKLLKLHLLKSFLVTGFEIISKITLSIFATVANQLVFIIMEQRSNFPMSNQSAAAHNGAVKRCWGATIY